MDVDLLEARKRAASQKLWGRHPHNAIMTGQWDNGSIVRNALQEVQNDKNNNR